MSWYAFWLPHDSYCIEFIWFQYISCTTYQSLGSVENESFIDEMGQPWISNCICLIYQARSNNENQNKLKGKGLVLYGITYSSTVDEQEVIDREKKTGLGPRCRRQSSERCSGSQVHIWINAFTKRQFSPHGLFVHSAGTRLEYVSLTENERHRFRDGVRADLMFLFSYSVFNCSCLTWSLGWLWGRV